MGANQLDGRQRLVVLEKTFSLVKVAGIKIYLGLNFYRETVLNRDINRSQRWMLCRPWRDVNTTAYNCFCFALTLFTNIPRILPIVIVIRRVLRFARPSTLILDLLNRSKQIKKGSFQKAFITIWPEGLL